MLFSTTLVETTQSGYCSVIHPKLLNIWEWMSSNELIPRLFRKIWIEFSGWFIFILFFSNYLSVVIVKSIMRKKLHWWRLKNSRLTTVKQYAICWIEKEILFSLRGKGISIENQNLARKELQYMRNTKKRRRSFSLSRSYSMKGIL